MQVIIIEDETPAANRLSKLLMDISSDIVINCRLDSIESAVNYFHSPGDIDLVFMDIQLADGLCFEIFNQVTVKPPIIFTTAFDQYTLKAFKLNSIDYLLKPIDELELSNAVEKYKKLYIRKEHDFSDKILKLVNEMNSVKYKERLLIKRGQQLSYIKTSDTAFCYADGKLSFAVDFTGNKYLLDNNLSQLEDQLQPMKFYRINRNLIVNIDTVKKVHTWLGGRLKLELSLPTNAETVVSRERVNGFKEWLGS